MTLTKLVAEREKYYRCTNSIFHIEILSWAWWRFAVYTKTDGEVDMVIDYEPKEQLDQVEFDMIVKKLEGKIILWGINGNDVKTNGICR